MLNKMVLCSVAAGLAISLAACGQSDEAKCKEVFASQFPGGKVPKHMGGDFLDQAVKSCAAAAKLSK